MGTGGQGDSSTKSENPSFPTAGHPDNELKRAITGLKFELILIAKYLILSVGLIVRHPLSCVPPLFFDYSLNSFSILSIDVSVIL